MTLEQRIQFRLLGATAVLLLALPARASDDYDTAALLYQNQQPGEALQYVEKFEKSHPDVSDAHFLKGLCLVGLSEFERAIPAFTRAIELSKKEIDEFRVSRKNVLPELDLRLSQEYQNRGYCFVKLERYQLGIDDISTAIKLRPMYKINYLNRARAYEKLGQKALAQKDRAKEKTLPAVEPVVQGPVQLIAQARAEYDSGHYGRAFTDVQKAIDLDPGNGYAHILRAKLYLKTGHFQNAIDDCQRVLKVDPKNKEMSDAKERALYLLQHPDTARKNVRRPGDDMRFAD